jgi:hypothetical protein
MHVFIIYTYISSIPVYTEEAGTRKYIGFLDSLDVVSFIFSLLHDGHILPARVNHLIKSEKCMKISNLAKRHPFSALPDGSPMKDVIALMKEGGKKLLNLSICIYQYHS